MQGMMMYTDDVTQMFTSLDPITIYISQPECDNLGRSDFFIIFYFDLGTIVNSFTLELCSHSPCKRLK